MNKIFLIALLIAVISTGCGGPGEEPPAQEPLPSPEPSDPVESALDDVDDLMKDAPLLSEKYPALASEALRYARLVELPENILLRSGDMFITQEDLDDQIAQAPAAMRKDLRKNAFFILGQMGARKLLASEAKTAGVTGTDEMAEIGAFIEKLAADAEVSDTDVKNFYHENKEMMGNVPFAQIEPRIRDHLVQERKQEIIQKHIEETGLRKPIALSASWTEGQAHLVSDNVVDRARASGKPSFVSFGAETCMPCKMMEPFREEIGEKYGEKINVVYVNVEEEPFLSSRYGARAIPHIIFFDADGKEVHMQGGFMSLEQIEEWLKKIGV